MTDRTLRISARMAEEIQQWASDELSQWPRDTAYAADLENLLSQLTAAAPAPDAVAESDDWNTIGAGAVGHLREMYRPAYDALGSSGRTSLRNWINARAALAQKGGEA